MMPRRAATGPGSAPGAPSRPGAPGPPLATRAAWTDAQRSVRFLPAHVIPPGSLVVGLTPLHDLRMASALVDLRRRGIDVAAIELDVSDLVAPAAGALGVPAAAMTL